MIILHFKNGFASQKSFRSFRETGPCSGHEPFFHYREVCQKPPVIYLLLSIIVSKAFLVQIVSILLEKVTSKNCQEILVARKQKGFRPLRTRLNAAFPGQASVLLVSFAAARAEVTERSPCGRGALRDSSPSGCEGD